MIGTTRRGDMRWTDDTQMTIDLVESYLAIGAIDSDDLARRLRRAIAGVADTDRGRPRFSSGLRPALIGERQIALFIRADRSAMGPRCARRWSD